MMCQISGDFEQQKIVWCINVVSSILLLRCFLNSYFCLCVLCDLFSVALTPIGWVSSQALESEIVAHEPLIEAVATSAQQMIRGSHFAAGDIQTRLDDLTHQLRDLKSSTSARKLKLQAALEAQKVRGCLSLSQGFFCCCLCQVFLSFWVSLCVYETTGPDTPTYCWCFYAFCDVWCCQLMFCNRVSCMRLFFCVWWCQFVVILLVGEATSWFLAWDWCVLQNMKCVKVMFVWGIFKELFKIFMWNVLKFVSWITRR